MNRKRIKGKTRILLHCLLFSLCFSPLVTVAENIKPFIIASSNEVAQISVNESEGQVVHTSIQLFSNDVFNVSGRHLSFKLGSKSTYQIKVGTVGVNAEFDKQCQIAGIDIVKKHGQWEAYVIKAVSEKKKHTLFVVGSNSQGTAYGVMELSRKIGVSPWCWWADAQPEKKEIISLSGDLYLENAPKVKFRGIFINDEDWGLMPWSSKTYEPSDIKGQIGPKTHARIFELLLRLKVNTFWPAMHKCSKAFYLTPGNKETADKYGIYVGTSHCEPMMCNANAEWKQFGKGDYNYLSNRNNVLKFWENRVAELTESNNIYTLGMRGIHDGRMEGAKSVSEQKNALSKIIKDQRQMLFEIKKNNIEEIPQVFIPYKEVLEAYNAGLKVPDDVTLMWTDDNYGYIRHFPDSIEQMRKGGNGIYYHISYWGRPHDYLWLASTHPAQIAYQMTTAYNNGVKNMWILNVGDIKPAEYLIEYFMDLAWNINDNSDKKEVIDKHLYNWLKREFGNDMANELFSIMKEYYRLAYIRKPEFMGNTRTEEKDPAYKMISDLPWSESYIKERINDYEKIENKIVELSKNIPVDKQNSWFQLIKYPVVCASEMNKKLLYAQLARHGKSDWKKSDNAYEKIVATTNEYNAINGGKWNRIMTYSPRNLTVYGKVTHTISSEPLVENELSLYKQNGINYTSFNGETPVSLGLGYDNGAIFIKKGSSVSYSVENINADSISVDVALMPNHPVEEKQIRYAISVNNEVAQIVEYSTKGRSEEWKQNVLRNQAIRKTTHHISNNNTLTITIKALDEGVVLDQIIIN